MSRYPIRIGSLLAVALLLTWVACQPGEAGIKSDSKVKVDARAGKAEAGKQTISVTIQIDKGWHIYANPVENEDLADAKTVVEVKAGGKKLNAKVKYPAGNIHRDKTVGDYNVYEGKVTIEAVVEGKGPYEVNVRVQACDEGKCLLPAIVKTTVP